MNNTINQLEQIDQQLESLNNQDLLMIASVLINSNNPVVFGQIVADIGTMPKSLQGMVIDSIHAKVKQRRD